MTDFGNIPNGPHWAILRTESVTIPGDERSRTNPGHGYPEERRTYITYEAFTSQVQWENKIEELMISRFHQPFRAIKVEVADIKVRISVD